MHFGLTEEQEAIRKAARQFGKKELAAGYKDRGKRGDFPKEEIKRLAEVGTWGMGFPEEYGGQPADWVTIGLVIEELAKHDVYTATYMVASRVAGGMLRLASKEIQDEWFPGLINGDYMGYMGLTEPGCGSDAAALTTRAVKDGKGNYVISGEKSSISYVTFSEFGMVFARTNSEAGARGVSCFFVPKDVPGMSISIFPDLGLKPMARSSLFFDDVVIPESYLIGEEGKGFSIAMKQFDFARSFIALLAAGLAEASIEDAVEYAKQRKAFGQPIADFQDVSFKIAEHHTQIEATKLLAYRALWLKDQGSRHTVETAMAKLFGPRAAVQAIHDCLLIHGHYGYSEEYPIEQRLRDVIGYELGDGTAAMQKLIISRALFTD